jgi:hypothetical protein
MNTKAKTAQEVERFEDIPNIGPAMARDFALLGLRTPNELLKQDPLRLYKEMCRISGRRQDPCVLDTYMAAIDFMNGAPARPWFSYTKIRKSRYADI